MQVLTAEQSRLFPGAMMKILYSLVFAVTLTGMLTDSR